MVRVNVDLCLLQACHCFSVLSFLSHARQVIWSCDVACEQELSYLQYCTPFHIIMPKKSWASNEQLDWLFGHLPDFRRAQEAKTTPSFFTKIYQEFHSQWPLSSPTAEEIADDDGNAEQAQTTKEKASESVSDGFLYWIY